MEAKKRCIDELGRIVLPIEMREALNLKQGDSVDISSKDDAIILKKSKENNK